MAENIAKLIFLKIVKISCKIVKAILAMSLKIRIFNPIIQDKNNKLTTADFLLDVLHAIFFKKRFFIKYYPQSLL